MASRRDQVVRHVRRYPRWYAFALVWVVGMIALPVVNSRALPVFGDDTPTSQVDSSSPAPLANPPFASNPLAPLLALLNPTAPLPTDPALPAEKPPEFVEPTFLDTLFDLIPPPPALPNLPPALLAIVRAASPIAATGCTGLGLAGLVVAVVAPNAGEIPIERILPYLAPVTSACAYFPIPKMHTVCAADEPFIIDLAGLTKTPPILGLGVDQLTAIEDVVIDMFGEVIPRISDIAREQLDCKLVSE